MTPEIQQINLVAKKMAEDLVKHMNNI